MTRAEILDKAKECVCGQREQDYGKPEDNFATIADLWSTYKGTEFNAKDVAVMMSLMKIARIKTGTSTDDCFVDLAGYAACGGEIASSDKTGTDGCGVVIARAKRHKNALRITVDLWKDAIRLVNVIRRTLSERGRLTIGNIEELLVEWTVLTRNVAKVELPFAFADDLYMLGWEYGRGTKYDIDLELDSQGKSVVVLYCPVKLKKEDI